MTAHEQLYEAAKVAVTKLFSDESVSQAETRNSLEELIGEIQIMLDTLQDNDLEEE